MPRRSQPSGPADAKTCCPRCKHVFPVRVAASVGIQEPTPQPGPQPVAPTAPGRPAVPIRLACPECAQAIQVPPDAVGQRVRCPVCAALFVAEPQEARAAPRVSLWKDRLLNPWVLGAAGACVLALGLLVGVLASRKNAREPGPSPSQVPQETAQTAVPQLPPQESSPPAPSPQVGAPGSTDAGPGKGQPALPAAPTDFRDPWRVFLRDGRSMAWMLDRIPDVASYRLGMDVLAEAFAHIPDAPDGRQAAYQQLAHGILTTLATGSVHLKLRHEFFRRKAEAKVKS